MTYFKEKDRVEVNGKIGYIDVIDKLNKKIFVYFMDNSKGEYYFNEVKHSSKGLKDYSLKQVIIVKHSLRHPSSVTAKEHIKYPQFMKYLETYYYLQSKKGYVMKQFKRGNKKFISVYFPDLKKIIDIPKSWTYSTEEKEYMKNILENI